MAVVTEQTTQHFIGIVADVGLACNFPAFDVGDIVVTYGDDNIIALQNVDYDIELADDFSAFTVRPFQSLVDAIAALGDGDFLDVSRVLDYKTATTPAAAVNSRFISFEFDRITMRFQQLAGLFVDTTAAAASASAAAASSASAAANAASATGSASAAAISQIAADNSATAAASSETAAAASAATVAASLTNYQVKNADGAFTFATAATTTNISGAFGGTWKVAGRHISTDAATFAGSRATAAIMRQVTGSGANGPSSSDYALHVEATKSNYLTSAVLGEVDVLNLVLRQSEGGDGGVLLINSSKVESLTYGLVGVEMASTWVQATTGTVLRNIHTTINSHSPATDARQLGFGFSARADVGAVGTAHLVIENGGTWVKVFSASSTIAAGTEFFYVTGSGHADGAGHVRTGAGSAALPSQSFVGDTDSGFFSNGANIVGVATNGTLLANLGPAGVRIGTGLTDQGAGTVNVSATYWQNDVKVIAASGVFLAGNGLVGTPSHSFSGDPDTGFFSNGANVIGMTAGGTSLGNLGPTGIRIGVGLADPGAGILNVLSSIQINGTKVIGAQETGYTAGTGTALKGAFASYAGQTQTAVYVQATVQALDNAARDASQRVLALEKSMRTHGLTN